MNLRILPSNILEKWKIQNIRIIKEAKNVSVAHVFSSVYGESILKISPTVIAEQNWYLQHPEISAKVFAFSAEYDSLLLQYLSDTTLEQAIPAEKDTESIRIVAELINEIANSSTIHAEESKYRNIETYSSDLFILQNKYPEQWIEKARVNLTSFNKDHSLLLHGDLHHKNIIKSDDGWKIIDPHSVVGPILFEVGAGLRNNLDVAHKNNDLQNTLEKRIEIIRSTLGYSKNDIKKWAFTCTLLSCAWHLQDKEPIPELTAEVLKILY